MSYPKLFGSRSPRSATTSCEDALPGAPFFVIGVAPSAGGLEALNIIVTGLPDDFPACLLVVRHRTTQGVDLLPDILQKKTRRRVRQTEEGDPLAPGMTDTARPGWHLLVNPDDTPGRSDAPRVKFVRPAADLLFVSMAANLGERSVTVVLTGWDGDGSGGLSDIRAVGGRVIAQDPDSAHAPEMPISALEAGQVDCIIPLAKIASALAEAVV